MVQPQTIKEIETEKLTNYPEILEEIHSVPKGSRGEERAGCRQKRREGLGQGWTGQFKPKRAGELHEGFL